MNKTNEMKKKILVVDDGPDQILSIKLIFEFNNEYEVIGAKSGMECFDILNQGNIPDIILLDIMMPKMNGWEVFKHLKNNSKWKDIPIIVITALTGKDNEPHGELIPDEYIEKPYDLNDLKSKTIKILNKGK
jgi:CheY-like chemotaxis protein